MPLDTPGTRLYGGFRVLAGGLDMGTDPSLLTDAQYAYAENISIRGDLPITRAPWSSIPLNRALQGKMPGAAFYETPDRQGIVLVVGGRLYIIQVTPQNTGTVVDITPSYPVVTTEDFTVPAPAATVIVQVTTETVFTVGDTIFIDSGEYTVTNRFTNAIELEYVGGAANAVASAGAPILDSNGDPVIKLQTIPTTLDFVHIFQAEKYAIVLGRQQTPIIYDGSGSRLAGFTEIPSGVMGLYAWGRIWIALPDFRTFVAGDIVYGPSGTAINGFVDAILSFTENDFLNEGGFFAVPNNAGNITAMLALATIDTSLGIGPILIGTTNSVISVNAPVDRTIWKNLTYPIQTVSLLDYGPLAPYSTIPINNDMWFRSVDGLRSFIIGRRNMTSPGNTPLSHEVSPVLANDTDELLFHSSAMLFDNRFFVTVAPRRTTAGVVHDGLASVNFDLLSGLTTKQPPIWESFSSGLDILQLVRGRVRGVERAFALVHNEFLDTVELWEMHRENDGYYDTFQQVSGTDTTIVRTSIESTLETKRYSYERLVKLVMAELYLDEIVDEITLVIKFRPDQYPAWLTWATIHICANVTQCTISTPEQFSCQVWKSTARQYAARVRLPRPPEECNTIARMPVDLGYDFQFRFEGTGHFQLRKFRPHLKVQSDAMEGECPTQAVCTSFEHCPEERFTYRIDRGAQVPSTPALTLNINSTSSNIIVEWDQDVAPDTNEVWRSQNGGPFSMLGSIDGSLGTLTDTDAMGTGDIWCYKVRGIIGGIEGSYSNEGCAVNELFFLDTGAVSHPTWMLAFGDFGPDDPGSVTSLDLSGLKKVYGSLFLDTMASLTSVNLDSLESIGVDFLLSISGMVALSLPSFAVLGNTITANFCPNLATLTAPLWVSAGGDVEFDSNVITSISIPSFVMQNGKTYAFDNNGMPAAGVEHILRRGVLSGVTSATIVLDNNATLSSLSVQGQTDFTTLLIAGNSITIDP